MTSKQINEKVAVDGFVFSSLAIYLRIYVQFYLRKSFCYATTANNVETRKTRLARKRERKTYGQTSQD